MPEAAIKTFYSGQAMCNRKVYERYIYLDPSGNQYSLHAPPKRAVISVEGEGMPPISYLTQKGPFQHGESALDYRLQPRVIQMVVRHNFKSRMDYWEGRSRMLDLLRPNRQPQTGSRSALTGSAVSGTQDFGPGTLRKILLDGSKRDIDVLIQQGPAFQPWLGGLYFTEALQFIAHNPVYYDPDQNSAVLTSASNELTFPATFPIQFSGFSVSTTIDYQGNWGSFPTIAIDGPLNGPTITNVGTEESIALSYNIPLGETVTISLAYGNKSIENQFGTNLIQYLSSDSDLETFHIAPDPEVVGGDNQITVRGSSPGASTQVTITWNDMYIGI